jgi:hypothetical protein
MIKNTETFEETELIVDYNYQKSDSDNTHEAGYDTILNSVEVMIGKKSINILPYLDDKQIQFIIDKLNYE